MSKFLKIAEGVASLLSEYDANVVFTPDIDVRNCKRLRVQVLPVGLKRTFITRGSKENGVMVDVAFVKKCNGFSEVPELIEKVEEIGSSLLGNRIEGMTCLEVKWEPPFSVDELTSVGVFVGVIELTFKEVGL